MMRTINNAVASPHTGSIIRDLCFDGNMANLTASAAAGAPNSVDQYYGLNLLGADKFEVKDCEVRNVFRSAIYFIGSDDVKVHDNYVHDIGRLATDSGGDFEGSDYENAIIGRQGIQFDSWSQACLRPQVYNNHLDNILEHGIKFYPGCNDGKIEGNVIRLAKNFGVYLQEVDGCDVVNNTIIDPWQSGIRCQDADNFMVDGNSITDVVTNSLTNVGINCTGCTNHTIGVNRITNATTGVNNSGATNTHDTSHSYLN
jgi:parallel beta-helix repeat protein